MKIREPGGAVSEPNHGVRRGGGAMRGRVLCQELNKLYKKFNFWKPFIALNISYAGQE